MKIGDKIKILREIRGIAPKQMADELDMTPAGYLKIERNEVDVNTDKIGKISKALGIQPHELLCEDKFVLNFSDNEFTNGGYGTFFNTVNFPSELKSLYEDKIQLMQEQIDLLKDKIRALEGKQ